ncbi:hypothetical protein INQ23_24440, partial [Escherichia coli]|nr:hypothetical protein [Escherichia coli]
MTVAEFLAKADSLKAKGMLAAFSPDYRLLREEMEQVANGWRAELAAQQAAGRKPHSCPPPKGQVRMGGPELLAEFQKIPAAQRNVSVKTAFYAIMPRRYPWSG